MSLLTDLVTVRSGLEKMIGTDGTLLDEKKKKTSKFIKALGKGRSDIKDPEALGGWIEGAKSKHLAQWKKNKKGAKK